MINKKKFLLFLSFIIVSLIFFSCSNKENKILNVHFLDIGQGDSILIEINNKTLLIDAGPNDSEDIILKYLKSKNIKKLDYLIATHPHEDHIGNMDAILNNINVKKFLAPFVLYESTDFNNMILALKESNLTIDILNVNNKQIKLDDDVIIEIFSPNNENYENINNYSPIIKLSHFENSFLFTGDAEELIESKVLNFDIDSDVLKVAHHGSTTSSSIEFLNKVSPEISIISCGINNKFNHPSKSTLENLSNINSSIYRTDEDGTIVLSSNGFKIIKR